jgi:hypothetical protein
MEKVPFQVDYRPFVVDIQKSLMRQGLMQPLSLSRFERMLDTEVQVHKEVFTEELRNNWEKDFPGVPFSEDLLQKEVGNGLALAKKKAVEGFRSELMKNEVQHRRFKIIFGWVFRKWDAWLVATFFLSLCVTFPTFLKLTFAQSDLGFYSGILGLLINLSAVAYVAYKAEKEKGLLHE